MKTLQRCFSSCTFLTLTIFVLASAALVLATSGYQKIEPNITNPCNPEIPSPTAAGSCTTVTPGAFSFDISWVDAAKRKYYLADRNNAAVDIVDTATDTVVGELTGLVGAGPTSDTSGPNGVLVIDHPHQLWAGDGNSSVKVFSLNDAGTAGSLIASVDTFGLARADELAFDSRDNLVLIANDADNPPFVSFISVSNHPGLVGQIVFDNATNGIEQPVYDSINHKFYLAVPETTENPGGEIAVIGPRSMSVEKVYPLDKCEPHGLALGPDHNLLIGCSGDVPAGAQLKSLIMDSRNGHIVTTITEVGGSDEVWYNPGDNHYYLAASNETDTGFKGGNSNPVLGVIDAGKNTWIQNVTTGPSSHSVAADPVNNKIYVPLRINTKTGETGGIGVYAFHP